MKVKRSEYLKAWTKAKPLLLQKTGVSELLRKLPEDPRQSDLKTYETVGHELKTKIADRKIAAEKKAVACLQELGKDISDFLAHTKSQRHKAVEIMKRIDTACKVFYPAVQKGGIPQAAFHTLVSQCSHEASAIDMVTIRGQDKIIVPLEYQREFREAYDEMMGHADRMLALLKDSQTAKPTMNIKAEYPVEYKKFGEKMAVLHSIMEQVNALNP